MRALLGEPVAIPDHLLASFPELARARWRRGGIPPRIAGWFMRGHVAAVVLWRTVFLAPGAPLDPELLLHEFRHVHQFQDIPFFALRYIWETGRRGYHANRYEQDARRYAAERLAGNYRS